MSDLPAFDAVVVGGGPAGLSAALALGRSRRRVLLAADGPTRNAPADAAHNVFTRDGTPPADLVRIGREQLARYDVTLRDERATDARPTDTGFEVVFAGGGTVHTRGLVLATGVRDVLPDVPGFDALWGTGVFHCPYCHGWEVAGKPLALYNRDASAVDLAQLIKGWSDDLVLFTDGAAELSDDDRARLGRNGVVVRDERVERLVGTEGRLEGVVLQGGEVVRRAGLFVWPEQELRSDLATRLGCPLSDDGRVEADEYGRTEVPGVFVAGDAGPGGGAVALAAASGTTAGAMLNHDFLAQEFVP
jgi:thioredoxin reductase